MKTVSVTTEQKKRLWKLTKPMLVILLLGIAYAIWIKVTGLAVPCPIRLATGRFCPGCGLSRMMLALLRLDFETAYHANRFTFFLLPVILVYGLIKGIRYVRTGKTGLSFPEQFAIFLICVATVAFWVLRNTEQFSFLAPMG